MYTGPQSARISMSAMPITLDSGQSQVGKPNIQHAGPTDALCLGNHTVNREVWSSKSPQPQKGASFHPC